MHMVEIQFRAYLPSVWGTAATLACLHQLSRGFLPERPLISNYTHITVSSHSITKIKVDFVYDIETPCLNLSSYNLPASVY